MFKVKPVLLTFSDDLVTGKRKTIPLFVAESIMCVRQIPRVHESFRSWLDQEINSADHHFFISLEIIPDIRYGLKSEYFGEGWKSRTFKKKITGLVSECWTLSLISFSRRYCIWEKKLLERKRCLFASSSVHSHKGPFQHAKVPVHRSPYDLFSN